MSLLEHLHVLAVESYLEETFSIQTQSQFTFCVVYDLHPLIEILPIPMAARSKAWVCDHSLAGNAGSNPAGAWIFVPC
jgi:hypothetical protein